MKLPGKRTLLILLCALILGGLYFILRPKAPDPLYKGVPLSEWLAHYHSPVFASFMFDSARDPKAAGADEAIRAIGTNGLPLMLEWLDSQPMPFATNAANWLVGRRSGPIPNWRVKLVQFFDPYAFIAKRSHAYNAIRSLDSAARPAIPALQKIASRSLPDDDFAIHILTGLGSPAVSALTNALTKNPYPGSRIKILDGLGYIGSSNAVPAVIARLHDADPEVIAKAARNLGRIHKRADIAVPALIDAINHSALDVQRDAMIALGEFGSDAQSAEFTLYQYCNHFVLGDLATASLKKIQLPRFDGLLELIPEDPRP